MTQSAVFFDIDGTIWNYDHYIPDSAKEAIRLLRENGHKALLCSGRARAFIQTPALLALGWDGIVSACGCRVELAGEVAYEHLISPTLAISTVEHLRSYGIKPILEGPGYLYMSDEDFPVGDEYGDILRRDLGPGLAPIDGDNYGKWVINKMSLDTSAVPTDRRKECFDVVARDYSLIVHDENVMEIVPLGHNKGTGLLKACQLLGIDQANTFALGDSENDLEMLATAHTGIAMGNGTDNAKAAADYVTTAFDDDGIYNALKHFELI